MTIGFKARVNDPSIASYRYRVLTPIEALGRKGYAVELFDEARFERYEAVLFSKAYSGEDQALAARLRAAGKRAILDLCDDHFYNPFDLPRYRQARADLLAMIGLCNQVVCSTPVLAEAVRREAGLAYTPKVAPDSYEQASVAVGEPAPPHAPARLLWYGRHGSPNAEAGMADLLRIREALSAAHAKRPFVLTICSDSQEKYDELFSNFPVPTRFVAWTAESFSSELGTTDAVLIPLSDNAFVAAKTHNRLTLALSAGAPVVADLLESYREFSEFAYLGDWRGGLEAVLLRPREARERAAPARAYLERCWSAEATAPAWERALGLDGTERVGLQSLPSLKPETTMPAASFDQWIGREDRQRRPWLIAGRAADPAHVAKARAEGFSVLALGDAIRRFEADAALVIDIETISAVADVIERNAGVLLAPLDPHADGWASGRELDSWASELGVLQRLRSAERLIGFPLWTGSQGGIEGDFAGEEVALRLLVGAGVRMARHLGAREAHAATTGFEATRPVMDRRSGGIAALRRASQLSYGPYGYPVPARVFVGSDDEQLMGVKLLEYSIQKYSTMDVVVEPLEFRHLRVPVEPKNRSKTGFSFCRFDIPRLCGFQGRGVYVDADMQVFTDITELWTQPLDDADLLYALSHPSQGRTPQTSVMLLNAETLSWDADDIIKGLDEERYTYKQLMAELCIVPKGRAKPMLPYWWNSLERYEPGRTSLIHYTDMPTQPWISQDNRNGALWYETFAEALDEGFITEAEVNDAICKGHVSPELPKWVGRGASAVDEKTAAIWVAPYHRFTRAAAPVEGKVALSSDRRLVGWAYLPKEPDRSARLAVYVDGREVLTFEAGDYAEILQRHGKGSGRHAFDVPVPESLWRSNARDLRVKVADTGAELPGSPLEMLV